MKSNKPLVRVMLVLCTLFFVVVPAAVRFHKDEQIIKPTEDSHTSFFTTETLNTAYIDKSSSISSSSDDKEKIEDRVNTIGKRSAEPEDLPKSACNSDNGADELENGTSYTIFDVNIYPSGFDEGATFSVTCRVSNEEEKCNSWLKDTVQNISLVMNGEVQDKQFKKTYFPEENYVKFSATLHYESHHESVLSCLHVLDSGARLISANSTITRVDELHHFKITPETVDVTVGDHFALTCQTDSTRALERLRWKVQRNDDGNYVTMYREEREVLGLTYRIQDSTENLYSVVNVTRANEGKFKTRIDYNFTCTENFLVHLKQNEGHSKVSIHPVDYGVRDGLVGAGVGILVLSMSLTTFYFWRRRKLRAALAVVSRDKVQAS